MNKHIAFLASTAVVLLLQIGNCAAMASLAEPARSITVQARNGEQMTLSQTDLGALQSGFFNQIALPEEQGLPVEAITVLPIPSLRPLQLLLPGSQLTEADYDDVAEATILANLLIIPNGVDLFLKHLGEENIKLLCQLYRNPGLEGREGIKRYIRPFILYKRTQYLGVPPTISQEPDEVVYNTNPDIGHTGSITSVVLSPDGNTIVTGSDDRTIIVWHRDTDGQFRFNPQRDRLGVVDNTDPDVGHTSSVHSALLSTDGNTIISGSYDNTAIVWYRDTDGQFHIIQRLGAVNNRNAAIGHTKAVMSVVLSPDGKIIITTGSYDNTAIVWHRGTDGQFRFDPQHDRLGAVNNEGDRDIGHIDMIMSVVLSPDGNIIITGSDDHTAIVWHRGANGQFLFNPQRDRLGAVNNEDDPDVGHTSDVRSIALSPDSNTIISGSVDRTIIVWHRGTDGQFRFDSERDRLGAVYNTDPDVGHTKWVSSVALSHDGNTIITGSWDRTAIVWHRGADGQFRFNPERDRLGVVNNEITAIGRTRLITSVALSPDNSSIITGSADHSAIVWQQQSVDEFCAVQTVNIYRRRPRAKDELRGFCSIQ